MAASVLFLIVGGWLVLQAIIGDLARRLLSWRYTAEATTGGGASSGGGGGGGGSW
jgi:hypothetical protein